MARHRRKGLADDLLAVATRLPWWISVAVALVSFVVLHAVAGMDTVTATTTQDLGTVASRGLFRTLASIGQYVVLLIFAAGAVASLLGQRKCGQLVSQVVGSASPASLAEMSWSEFEALVQEAFRLKGYSVRRLGGDGPDGGADLVLERGSEKALVQCKQWRALRVGER